MGPHRLRCALILIDDDERSVQLLARLARQDSYSVAMRVGAGSAARHRNARMLARLLRLDGYMVDSSIGKRAAIDRLSRRPRPDALIVDVDAQSDVACALIHHARALSPELAVVLVTDRFDELGAAVDGVLPEPTLLEKPIEYAALRASLLSAVRPRTTSEIVPIHGGEPEREPQVGRTRR